MYILKNRYGNQLSDVAQRLRECGVSKLYHFTNIENVSSIKKLGGLYSRRALVNRGISSDSFGGNYLSSYLDERLGLDNYVHLSFCSDHPMKYRLEQKGYTLVQFEINISVVDRRTVFSNVNATSSSAKIASGLDGFNLVKLSATRRTYVCRDDPDFEYHQAEALVPNFIPLSAISNFADIEAEERRYRASESDSTEVIWW